MDNSTSNSELDEIAINADDLVISSWSSKKQGGFSIGVPKGIKITHLPSRITVTCDTERSQHRNRYLALLELQRNLKSTEDKPTLLEIGMFTRRD